MHPAGLGSVSRSTGAWRMRWRMVPGSVRWSRSAAGAEEVRRGCQRGGLRDWLRMWASGTESLTSDAASSASTLLIASWR